VPPAAPGLPGLPVPFGDESTVETGKLELDPHPCRTTRVARAKGKERPFAKRIKKVILIYLHVNRV
jgi:hypothetical protein